MSKRDAYICVAAGVVAFTIVSWLTRSQPVHEAVPLCAAALFVGFGGCALIIGAIYRIRQQLDERRRRREVESWTEREHMRLLPLPHSRAELLDPEILWRAIYEWRES